MRGKLIAFLGTSLLAPFYEAAACSTCFGNYRAIGGPPPANIQHMAMAIWVLMFMIMTVLGGIGMFSLHLWRHSRMPVQPHEELAEEDLSDYA